MGLNTDKCVLSMIEIYSNNPANNRGRGPGNPTLSVRYSYYHCTDGRWDPSKH